jgi:hypothetical protein
MTRGSWLIHQSDNYQNGENNMLYKMVRQQLLIDYSLATTTLWRARNLSHNPSVVKSSITS